MAKTKLSHRAFALSLALLFLITTVGFSALVIWQMVHGNKNPTTTQNKPKENTLAGTKLANFQPVAKIDQLQAVDLKEGTGDTVKAGATVTAHYTGAVAATGVIFQSSHDSGQPVQFPLSGVIQGWQNGVPGVKAGGTRRLLIPAALAYGANPPPGSGIPANADLVFDIELVSVQNP